MKKIVIVRHGESEGNANNIIQGRNNDYGLTEKGKKVTYLNLHSNIDAIRGARRIISSTSNRTMETAEIISNELGIQIFENSNIKEIDAGILSGMDKDEANTIYPNYYQIWKKRQDLDEIPNAEKGEDLQDRVLSFLMQYYDKVEYCDIIVSHAGFIRCLINTIENRDRTFQFNIENSAFFSINDIFRNMSIQRRERAMNSKVLIITTPNGKYVAKLKKGKIVEKDYAEQSLLNNLEGDNIPKVLCLQNYDNGEYCKIIKYVKGKHIYGKLNDDEYKALIKSEKELESVLDKYKNKKIFEINNLRKKVETIYKNAKNSYIKELAKELLMSKQWSTIEDTENYVLSHNDLNRDNILFERTEDGSIKANIIDFESLELAPKDFQFASMIASGLLLEGENIQKLKETIKQKNMDLERILFLMQIRVLEGLYFFQENSNEYVLSRKDVTRELLKKYFFSNEIIQKEMENLKKAKGDNKDNEKILYK